MACNDNLRCAKFYHDRLNGCGDIAIYWFSKWRPSAILDLLYFCCGPPTNCTWWSLSLWKIWFESVWYVVLTVSEFNVFLLFSLKIPIHAPYCWFSVVWLLNGSSINWTPKQHICASWRLQWYLICRCSCCSCWDVAQTKIGRRSRWRTTKTCKYHASAAQPKIIFLNFFNLHYVPCVSGLHRTKTLMIYFYMSCTV